MHAKYLAARKSCDNYEPTNGTEEFQNFDIKTCGWGIEAFSQDEAYTVV